MIIENTSHQRAFCERPLHPQPYMHECLPRCESVSLRSKERCYKNEGHEDFHWVVRENDVEIWGVTSTPAPEHDDVAGSG